jgi:LuxR family transcriptional regulator, quorum-sensing system regulator BjaR1
MGYYDLQAFDFIDRIRTITDPKAVFDDFCLSVAQCGYSNVIVTGLPSVIERFETKILQRHWPPGWFEVYTTNAYIRDDPVGWYCRHAMQPFEWKEAYEVRHANSKSTEIMNAAGEFGMKEGFCIPIRGLLGITSCISLSGIRVDHRPVSKESIHLMSIYVFYKVCQSLQRPASLVGYRLTVREREVITWTAMGKSAWEIGHILGIAADTVNKHVSGASRKLGTVNKTQTVAEAIRLQEISL